MSMLLGMTEHTDQRGNDLSEPSQEPELREFLIAFSWKTPIQVANSEHSDKKRLDLPAKKPADSSQHLRPTRPD